MAVEKKTTEGKKIKGLSALDELFIYAYRLRKNDIDPTVVETLTKAYLVGAPSCAFELTSSELTDDQKKLIENLENNGFETRIEGSTIIVKNVHLHKIKEAIDKMG